MSRASFPELLTSRYQCLGQLGAGAMGAVFRAMDLQLGREVAVKVLTLVPEPEILARMEREARVMGRLQHPGIVEVFDSGVCEGRPYLVMELLEGHDLSEAPPGEDPLPGMLEVAEALDVLHDAGVLHRDVKPANLFRTRDGRTLLTDFGLAFDPRSEALTRTGIVVGTLSYLAPETLRSLVADARGDWWAWAVSLFQLCEERLPFEWEDVLAAARAGDPLPPLRFRKLRDPSLQFLLRTCLEIDPDARPGSSGEIRALLGAPREANPGGGVGSSREAAPGQISHVPGVSGDFSPVGSFSESASSPAAGGSASRLREGEHPSRAFALVLGLLFLLGGGALLGVRASRGGEGAGPEAPSPGEVPFDREYPEEVRAAVNRAGWWYRSPSGEEREFRSSEPPQGWREVLSADPADWGRVVGRFPELTAFRDWQSGGGTPEELPRDLLRDLGEVDEVFQGLGLPRPFFPFLYARPRAEVTSPGRAFLLRGQALEASGWLGTAARAAVSATRRQEAMIRVLEEGRSGTWDPPPEFPEGNLGGFGFLGLRNPQLFQKSLWHQDSARARSGPWSLELGEEVHLLLYAASRAFEELEPEEALPWSLAFYRGLRKLTWWPYSHLARLDLRWLLRNRGGNSACWLLEFAVLEEQAHLARDYSWPRETLIERTREALNQWLERAGEEGLPPGSLAFPLRKGILFEFRIGDPQRLLARYRSGREVLLAEGWGEDLGGVLPVVLWAGKQRAGEPDALSQDELQELLAWYRRFPDEEDQTFGEVPAREWVQWARGELAGAEN